MEHKTADSEDDDRAMDDEGDDGEYDDAGPAKKRRHREDEDPDEVPAQQEVEPGEASEDDDEESSGTDDDGDDDDDDDESADEELRITEKAAAKVAKEARELIDDRKPGDIAAGDDQRRPTRSAAKRAAQNIAKVVAAGFEGTPDELERMRKDRMDQILLDCMRVERLASEFLSSRDTDTIDTYMERARLMVTQDAPDLRPTNAAYKAANEERELIKSTLMTLIAWIYGPGTGIMSGKHKALFALLNHTDGAMFLRQAHFPDGVLETTCAYTGEKCPTATAKTVRIPCPGVPGGTGQHTVKVASPDAVKRLSDVAHYLFFAAVLGGSINYAVSSAKNATESVLNAAIQKVVDDAKAAYIAGRAELYSAVKELGAMLTDTAEEAAIEAAEPVDVAPAAAAAAAPQPTSAIPPDSETIGVAGVTPI